MITANHLCKGSNLPKITIIIDVLLSSLIQDFSNVCSVRDIYNHHNVNCSLAQNEHFMIN